MLRVDWLRFTHQVSSGDYFSPTFILPAVEIPLICFASSMALSGTFAGQRFLQCVLSFISDQERVLTS